jgi:predicted esterase
MKIRILTIVLMISMIISCKNANNTEQKVVSVKDWSSPEKIDPLSQDVGDFLDESMRDYMIQADEAYWEKNYKKAAQHYLYMLSHNVYDIISTYNLSCTYGLMGKPDLSAKFLFKAVDLGFVDFRYIKNDTDFDKVRGTATFDAAIDSIGQMIKNLGEIYHIESTNIMSYRLVKPMDFHPDKKYDLVIGLHSFAGSHDQFVKIWKHFYLPEFIFAVPQAPFPVQIGLAKEFRWQIEDQTDAVLERSDQLSEDYLVKVIREIKGNNKVNGIYLLGLHQGTTVGFNVALKYPDLVDGLIAFGTKYDIENLTKAQLKKVKDLKLFISNSPDDQFIDQEQCLKLKEGLENNGMSIEYHVPEGKYSLTKDILKKSEEWLVKH